MKTNIKLSLLNIPIIYHILFLNTNQSFGLTQTVVKVRLKRDLSQENNNKNNSLEDDPASIPAVGYEIRAIAACKNYPEFGFDMSNITDACSNDNKDLSCCMVLKDYIYEKCVCTYRTNGIFVLPDCVWIGTDQGCTSVRVANQQQVSWESVPATVGNG